MLYTHRTLKNWPFMENPGEIECVNMIHVSVFVADEFQGYYGISLNRRCWSSDSNRVLFQTLWRSKVVSII